MATLPKSTKRRTYDAAFRAEALRLASESRSTQAAARALNTNPKLLYKWQQAVQTPAAVAVGANMDPATAAELRQLRADNRRQAQELEILKKPLPSECSSRIIADQRPMSRYSFINQHCTSYHVRRLCQVLSVAPSRYYAWQQRQQQALGPQEPGWEVALDQTFEAHKKRNGTRQLCVALPRSILITTITSVCIPALAISCLISLTIKFFNQQR